MGIHERKKREREWRSHQIMTAARKLFSTGTMRKITIDDIAAEAEVSSGTVYCYFKNKEELYSALSIQGLNHLLLLLEDIRKQEGCTLARKIEAIKRALLDSYRFDPDGFVRLFSNLPKGKAYEATHGVLFKIKCLLSTIREVMTDIFRECMREELPNALPPAALADMIWSLFAGVVILSQNQGIASGDCKVPELNLDTAFHILQRGINPKMQHMKTFVSKGFMADLEARS